MASLEWKVFKPKPEFAEGLHSLRVIPASYNTYHGVTYRVVDTVTADDTHMREDTLLKFWEPEDEKAA